VTKRKTKLVYVGWGIVMYPHDVRPYLLYGISGWSTRREAIEEYEKSHYTNNYQSDRRRHKAIAKKLWVEVRDGKV